MQIAPLKLLVYTAIGTIFGCLSAVISRCAIDGAAAAARAALTVDVIAAAIVVAAFIIAWRKDHAPLVDIDEDDEAFKKRLEARINRAAAVAVAGVMLFGAIFGAFYAQAGGGYLLAGLVAGVATTIFGLWAQLDYYYKPSLLMFIYLAESTLIILAMSH